MKGFWRLQTVALYLELMAKLLVLMLQRDQVFFLFLDLFSPSIT